MPQIPSISALEYQRGVALTDPGPDKSRFRHHPQPAPSLRVAARPSATLAWPETLWPLVGRTSLSTGARKISGGGGEGRRQGASRFQRIRLNLHQQLRVDEGAHLIFHRDNTRNFFQNTAGDEAI